MRKKIVILLAVLIATLCVLTVSAGAATVVAKGTCGDNVSWRLNSEDTLTISGEGPMTDFEMIGYDEDWGYIITDCPLYDFQPRTIVINDGVTHIGDYAFYPNAALENITIPASVTSIGEDAFLSPNRWGFVFNTNYKGSAEQFYKISNHAQLLGHYDWDGNYYERTVYYGVPSPILIVQPEVGGTISADKTAVTTARETITVTATAADGYTFSHLLVNGKVVEDLQFEEPKTDTVTISAVFTRKTLYSGNLNENVSWGLTEDGTLFLTGDGVLEYDDVVYDSIYNEAWWIYSDEITALEIGNDIVTNLEDWEFYRLDNLCSVVFGNGVFGNISDWAFHDYKDLSSVVISGAVNSIGDYAFYGCTGLTSITIPDSVESIGEGAFYECDDLTEVTLGSGITSIGYGAFGECSSLTDVYYTGDVAGWCAISFADREANPASVVSNFFIKNARVTELVIPDSVTAISSYAFYGRSELTSVVIGSGVESIGYGAFYECKNLEHIEIGQNVKTIAENAFGKCGYPSVYYAGDVAGWCSIDFVDGEAWSGSWYLYIGDEPVADLVIPNGVTEIKAYAFYVCTNLKSIEIPDSVTSIGEYAFTHCISLDSATLGSGVESIGQFAFYNSALGDVYYAGTKKQWNAISIGSGNGRLTGAVIHFAEPEAPTVDTEVSLDNGIASEFTIETSSLTGTNNYAVIAMGGKTVRMEQSDWVDGKIVYDDIAMKDLTQTVTMGIYDAAGNKLAEQSVCVYDAMKARLDAETNVQKKAEYTAQLHLAAAAQKYFDHNVGNLASKDLTETVGDMTEHRKDESSLSGKDKSIIYGTSCVLGNELQIKIYFTANDKDVFINGEKVEPTVSPTEGYYFYCMNVNPADIFESVSIEVKDGDTVLATARDSIASYCARLYAMGGEKNETLADALLNYGVAARAAEV